MLAPRPVLALILALIVVSLIPGCTVIGGVSGYTVGRVLHDGDEPQTYKTARGASVKQSPVVTDTLIGLGIGLVLDVAAIVVIEHELSKPLFNTDCPCSFD